jgi:hypothetical protein
VREELRARRTCCHPGARAICHSDMPTNPALGLFECEIQLSLAAVYAACFHRTELVSRNLCQSRAACFFQK